jgi:acyl-[acyl-carrier-protein]-phospholipid O-acyltransferase/long-chain-fatty-acid--[acyl-carrier-protein] ligase
MRDRRNMKVSSSVKPWYVRAFLAVFAAVFYRIRAVRPDRLPATGGALLVSNHVSFVDMLLILASTQRFVRFLLPTRICSLPLLRPLLKRLRVIPFPDDPRGLETALRQASDAIRKGEVVGIFAEKNISRIGIMLPFSKEMEQVMAGVEAPVVPVCLDGVWGSIFSYQAGKFFWKMPRRLPYPVTVSFGEPLPPNASAVEVRQAIQDLNSEAWHYRRETMRPLGRAFVHCARRYPFRFAMTDNRAGTLNFIQVLAGAVLIARRLRSHWKGQKTVGVLLPSTVGGALVNLAALLCGKVVVNLNYTLSEPVLASCAAQADLKVIITSKQFLQKVKLELPCPALFLEDVLAKPRALEKLVAFTLACLAPMRLLEKITGADRTPRLDDLATLVFSSGSTGSPKGVMLSHYNLLSNVQQLGQTYDFSADDRFLGILPFFHAFGYTATLLVPAVLGIGVLFHADPREGKIIGELARRYGATYLMATPSLLGIYARMCEPEHFGSLRFVMAGAEKLLNSVADAFEEKFGIRPVEGYGCTECSPVVAANRLNFRGAGLRQPGSHRGKIGHPMPGMSVRIVEPESGKPLPPGKEGVLHVRGPNVMQGYLNRAKETAAVLKDGWYNTDDIAVLDEDGFLEIKGRRKRFIKVAGEMVPLDQVQEKLHELANAVGLVFAVTGVPDETRGERLVVLHTLDEAAVAELPKQMLQLKLPSLWIPKANQFYHVTELPLAGPSKLDLRKLSELAIRFAVAKELERREAA